MSLRVVPLLSAVLANATLAPAQTQLSTVRIASGLSSPTYVTSPVGDEDRLFVCEQNSGLIKVIKRGVVLPTPFLNVRAAIQPGGEQGLLGMAFDPRYPVNGFFYVSYSRAGNGASVIARYSVSASNPDVAAANSGVVCFGPIAQPYTNHNGGNIQFGPDGKLYFGLGDGGSADDPHCHAQNRQSLLGKMLRLDVSTVPFSVPADNPFVGNAAYRPEIWSLGLRNPWRFSFDRLTGDMFIGDVGQSTQEELDFEPAGTGGRNYGWKVMEGTNCFSTAACTNPPACNSPALTRPFHTYANSTSCSITGGYVYRGCAIPDLRGTYIFGDFCSGRIWSLRYSGSTVVELRDRTTELVPGVGLINEISSFGEDARGELYVVDHFDGEIFKIVALDGGPAVDLGLGKTGSNGEIPFFEVCGRLERGASAEFILRRAPANTPAVLVLSLTNTPIQIWGGTLVPIPPTVTLPVATDPSGRVSIPVRGAPGRSTVYGQWVMYDAGASFGFGISNALRIKAG